MSDNTLLKVEEVSKRFKVRGQILHAVEKVSFELDRGQTLGLVGESGSGKSTLGRVVLRLLRADEGRVVFRGRDLTKVSKGDLRQNRRDMQIIFQDPIASLSPRMTVERCIADGMIIQNIGTKKERIRKVHELMERVGLPLSVSQVYPFELSGGQQQRVGIARALAVDPKLVVCDEPISALDVSIQLQIIQLLLDIQRERDLAYIFISHNLGVVKYLSDNVMVLYLGEVVEQASTKDLFESPSHPYTRTLMNSILRVPSTSAERRPLTSVQGEIPSPFNPPSGCPFHPRCPIAEDKCQQIKPERREIRPGHRVACHLA